VCYFCGAIRRLVSILNLLLGWYGYGFQFTDDFTSSRESRSGVGSEFSEVARVASLEIFAAARDLKTAIFSSRSLLVKGLQDIQPTHCLSRHAFRFIPLCDEKDDGMERLYGCCLNMRQRKKPSGLGQHYVNEDQVY